MVRADEFRAGGLPTEEQRETGNRLVVRPERHVRPVDGAVRGGPDPLAEQGEWARCGGHAPVGTGPVGTGPDGGRIDRESAAARVVDEAAVEYGSVVGGEAGEALARRGVGGRIEDDVGVAGLDDGAGSVPLGRAHVEVGGEGERERPGGADGVVVGPAEAEVDVVGDPRSEKARTDEFAERIADGDVVAGGDVGVDVEDPRCVSVGGPRRVRGEVDDNQVVVGGGVGFRGRVDGTSVDDLAGDGRGGIHGVGVEVDGTAAVVGGVRGVEQGQAGVATAHGGGERDGHRRRIVFESV